MVNEPIQPLHSPVREHSTVGPLMAESLRLIPILQELCPLIRPHPLRVLIICRAIVVLQRNLKVVFSGRVSVICVILV